MTRLAALVLDDASVRGNGESCRRPSRGAMRPDLVVDTLERVASHHTQRDLVRELLGLQVGVVREDPDVTELVRDDRPQILVAQ